MPLFRFFAEYFRPYRFRLILILLASLLDMAFNAQIPMSVKFMIDRALIEKNQRMMLIILAALAASALVVPATSLWRDYLYAGIVSRIISTLRARMFERLQWLSLDYYARTEVADVISRFSNDIAAVQRGLAITVSWGLRPLLDLFLSAVLLMILEWRLATLGILLCPLCLLGPHLLSKRSSQSSALKQEQESQLLTSIQEAMLAPALIRAFNFQYATIGRFQKRNELLSSTSIRLGFLTSLMERSASFAILVLQALIMGISGYLAFRGVISIGTFATFQALFVTLSYSFMFLAQYYPNLVNVSGGFHRIEELLREKPKVADAPEASNLPPLGKAIEFRDITFRYPGADPAGKPNLQNLGVSIRRGESVAFVGPSGSGKSTVLNLLLRFYDPESGAVLFDGVDLRQATQGSVRDQMGVVFQESFLFNATIRENIALGKPNATEQEITDAAKAAEIHDFIAALPDGYETLAGERGSRFSGGQRQRIAIARALLKDPSILVLDEATSALDPETEHAINLTFERLARGRTMISVTHRLSSVLNMDRIFVLDQGRLAEHGRHTELLQAEGIYAKMWQKQSGVQFSVVEGQGKAVLDASWLRELPLMKGVGADTLAELIRWFATEEFAADRVIFEEGDAGNAFYVLARGTVEVLRKQDGGARRLAKLSQGDYFGEMALLSNQPRNATIRSLTPCVCLSLHRDLFQRLLAQEPTIQEQIRHVFASRAAS